MKIHNLGQTYLERCRAALDEEQAISLRESNNWAHVDRVKVHADWNSLYKELAEWIDYAEPSDPQLHALVDRHFELACRFYLPSKEAYIGMALFYADNAGMHEFHRSFHPRLVEVLGDAMCRYAQEKL
jgi:hypothetical protein